MASPGSSTVPIVSAHFCSLWEVVSCESLSSIGMLLRRTEMLENVFWYVLTWALGNAAIARIWVLFASVRCIQPLRCAARMRATRSAGRTTGHAGHYAMHCICDAR